MEKHTEKEKKKNKVFLLFTTYIYLYIIIFIPTFSCFSHSIFSCEKKGKILLLKQQHTQQQQRERDIFPFVLFLPLFCKEKKVRNEKKKKTYDLISRRKKVLNPEVELNAKDSNRHKID